LGADEFGFKPRLAILKEHGNHLAKVCMEFIKRLRLRMGSGKTRDVANEQPGVRVAFDNGGEIFSWLHYLCFDLPRNNQAPTPSNST
jgi:hypothetical protein